jgi:hypothetical protein
VNRSTLNRGTGFVSNVRRDVIGAVGEQHGSRWPGPRKVVEGLEQVIVAGMSNSSPL